MNPTVLSLVTAVTLTQSPTVLEAVRLRRPAALTLAQKELQLCQQSACPQARQLSLLVGFLQLSEGYATDALEQLSSLPAPSGLEPFHAFYSAQALFYSRDFLRAADAFAVAQTNAPPWLMRMAQSRQAEALLAGGAAARAAPMLEIATNAQPSPELFFQRAMARKAIGNPEGSIADLRTLALRYPAHPYAAVALEQLRVLKPQTVRFTFEERLTRARGLLDESPRAALDELAIAQEQKLIRGASALARAALVRAQAYYALGQSEDAIAEVEVARKGQTSIAAEATMLRARMAMRANDNTLAKTLLREIDRKWVREGPADDAAYLVGWIEFQAGRFTEALAAFAEFATRHPRSRKQDEALWFQALAHIRLNQFPQAQGFLQMVLQRFPRSSLVPQARYWVARCAQLQGSSEEAARGYRELIPLFPGSFYAALASERLREMKEEPPRSFPEPPKAPKSVSAPKELALARQLANVGLFKDAGQEVASQIARVRSPDQALTFGHALAALGEYGAAHTLAARALWGAAFGSREATALALFYPRAFQNSVETHSKSEALDPYFVWAIMRRESAYRAEVLSAANARGLMQIIPPTAMAIAKELALPSPAPDELFSPELNIRMGAWYLKRLLDRFQHPALAAAAYNAGPTATVKWAKEKGELPLDLFVEEIPFKETRGYVKQVVADYLTYHTLYGGSAPRLAMKVPPPAEAGVTF